MLAPEQDLEDRLTIWVSMQMLFMDTDPESELEFIAGVCAESKYSLDELEEILINEVQPSLRSNLFMNPIPEWAGLDSEFLQKLILKKHRFGKRRQIFATRESKFYWSKISPLIAEIREASYTNS